MVYNTISIKKINNQPINAGWHQGILIFSIEVDGRGFL
jgi:hypothetical protein